MNPQTSTDARLVFKKTNLTASKNKKIKVVACPPFVFLPLLNRKSVAMLGSQDISSEMNGSHTGSISGAMLKDAGVKFVIVGHSERRALGEKDELIGKKTSVAIDAGLTPIICVGEESRDNDGLYLEKVASSLRSIFVSVPHDKLSKVIVAYEPVWAVGKSYNTALSPSQIHEMILFIRKILIEMFPKNDVMSLPILYGGSVDFENAKLILSDGEVGGLLIGRQSLEQGFADIISYANKL
jgi:triosephosphate isomerase